MTKPNAANGSSPQPSKPKPINPKQALPPIPSLQGMDRLWVFLAVGLGSGLTPKAQGTSGSAAILLLVPLWVWLGFWPSLLLVLLMSAVGMVICDKAAHLMAVSYTHLTLPTKRIV